MTAELYLHRFGPTGPAKVLLLHGLTGHGKRWRSFAEGHLADVAALAPDLIGHGRSSYDAPWTFDANVAALATLIENEADGPVVVVGHSFGGATALHLAAQCPDLVSGLVLLDPAIGLDGWWMSQVSESMLNSPYYTSRDEARVEKATGSWSDVPESDLDEDLDEHLMELARERWGWRISIPAMMSYWSELARDIVLPHRGTPTTLVRALQSDPPYVGPELIDSLAMQLGTGFRLVDLDCKHMVFLPKPVETAALIRDMLG